MLIALKKNIIKSHNEVTKEKWLREPNRGFELEQQVIGLIGYGHTAQAFAKLLSVFDVEVLAFDTDWNTDKTFYTNTKKSTLEELQHRATIVSYHVPLQENTANYYSAADFVNKHVLINTSRGAVCNTQQILEGFQSGKLIGACLDVLDFEHLQPFGNAEQKYIDELLQYPCIITPHIAGYSFNAIENMSAELMKQLENYFSTQ
jgi:D-3-phosphoglycerate dehydrogenase / 2-oxoglutarate reductase